MPIGFDKTISQPFIGALMLELLDIEPSARVLEVGTGFGYQAAVMADMGAEVFSVEVVEEFAEAAKARFGLLGYDIQVRVGDGSRGMDRACAVRSDSRHRGSRRTAGDALVEQLEPGGRMVIPIGGDEIQQLSVVEKDAAGEVKTREIMPVRFTKLEVAV